MSRVLAPRARCLLVWAATTLLAGLVAGWLLPHLARAADTRSTTSFEEWLVLGCEVATVVGSCWLWLLVTLVSLEAARGTGPAAGVPAAVRRLVLAACGVGLAGGLVSPAYAVTPPSPLAGLPLPDRPTGHALARDSRPERPAPVAGHRPDRDRTVRVAPGDSLWELAVSDLPGDATLGDVDERWRTIHAANRRVIGEDPDLILPGQQLRLPPTPPSAT